MKVTEAPKPRSEADGKLRPAGFKRVAAAIFLGSTLGLIMAVLWASGLSAQPPGTSPSEIYATLRRDADNGDRRAKELVAAVDTYTKRAGISIEEMGSLGPGTTNVRALGPIRLRVEDHAPWGISIRNFTELPTESDLDAYVALRTGALRKIASSTPQRELHVVATPNRFVDLDKFIRDLGCTCSISEVVVDVFVDGEWAFMSFVGLQGVPDQGIFDDVLSNAEQAAAGHLPGVTRDELRLTVRRISLTATAAQARELSGRPDILLVDPLDDLGDPYRGRAALVEVTGGADLFYGHAKWNLGVALDATPSSPGVNGGKP
jgi:hypothetical protein